MPTAGIWNDIFQDLIKKLTITSIQENVLTDWFYGTGLKTLQQTQKELYQDFITKYKKEHDNQAPKITEEYMISLKHDAFNSVIQAFKNEFTSEIKPHAIAVDTLLTNFVENADKIYKLFSLIQTDVNNLVNAEKERHKKEHNREMRPDEVSHFSHATFKKLKESYPDKVNLIDAHLELLREFRATNGPCGVKTDTSNNATRYGRLHQPPENPVEETKTLPTKLVSNTM